MKFGPVPIAESQGAILAHSVALAWQYLTPATTWAHIRSSVTSGQRS